MKHPNDIQKLGELIEEIRIAMLVTVAKDGTLHSRPMGTQMEDFDGTLWFFTEANSGKAEEIDTEERVNVIYSEPKRELFVSVSGNASLVFDRAEMKKRWNPLYHAWFPKGLEDPNIALLKVSVEKAEYWETPASKVIQLAGFAKAILTGKRYKPEQHEKFTLPH
ncbi:MAG: pyridoxamine 5'-phosphate oxidase family protein [Cryobacterium sp.]|nr:pyridoxamine 5'-phosphate oxidase family protein [Oligoflexia bacterium]